MLSVEHLASAQTRSAYCQCHAWSVETAETASLSESVTSCSLIRMSWKLASHTALSPQLQKTSSVKTQGVVCLAPKTLVF